MRKTRFPFADKAQAEKFAKEKGGRVVGFAEMPDEYIFKIKTTNKGRLKTVQTPLCWKLSIDDLMNAAFNVKIKKSKEYFYVHPP